MDEAEAKTIAEIHGLDVDDPWDKRGEARKQGDALLAAARGAVDAEPQEAAPFVDPPERESLLIDGGQRRYHRIVACGHKLSELVAADPGLATICVASANNAAGCWLALNSERVARRVMRTLADNGLSASLGEVDGHGQPAGRAPLTDEQLDGVQKALGAG